MTDGAASPSLYEVAVTLPVRGTYTYRDPRRGAGPLAAGTQVVVPFGKRTVTGFVLGPAPAAELATERRDLEEIVAGAPAFDEAMIAFCRWAADYYQAPLGEVLRAALPQGEKGAAVRAVRLTDRGRAALEAGQRSLLGESDGHPVLVALAKAGGELALRSLARLVPRAPGQLARLTADGLVEVGDEVRTRRAPPTEAFVVAAEGAREGVLPARAAARRALLARVVAAGAEGLATATLEPKERAHVKALADAGLARVERRAPARGAARGGAASDFTLTDAQAAAVATLTEAMRGGFAPFVLHGVTGSGKTEVYLRVIAEARAAGRGALVLVPEIALTPQLASRFRARFGDDVAVLHSALPPGERLAAWRALRAGEVGIAVGARSAVFAPVRELGVVVVDEEHDGSFKQEEGVRYHGRDLAVVRAQRAGAVVILGSATPSLETAHNVARGRFTKISLPSRATKRALPTVELVDLKRHPPGPDGLLSAPLAEAIAAALAAREQVILFLNRRGFSTVVLCRACGHVVRCANCSVSMTYHRARGRLVCHYCATTAEVPVRCPACRSTKLERLGMGTERVESVVRERFPDARVARLDRDTAGARAGDGADGAGLHGVLRRMQAGEIDVLVGTQMVTKGHDFAGVTLVGVLQPDQALNLPDFRAAERTFQLLEQVAGRAGRGERPGRVLIQTYDPEHPAIACVQTHDYDGFVRGELVARRDADYPPFSRMVALRIDAADERTARAAATAAAEAARAASTADVVVRGPAEAPIPRVRGRARYQVWLAGHERVALITAARAGASVKLPGDARLVLDVDPQSVL
ncbi:MAG TPA: primosomal protein N' [Polyangia bacterium]|nr:primosomal protein N' [Polyangia bacterium]